MVLKGQTSKLLKQLLNIRLHKNLKYIIKTLKEPDSLSQHNSLWGNQFLAPGRGISANKLWA